MPKQIVSNNLRQWVAHYVGTLRLQPASDRRLNALEVSKSYFRAGWTRTERNDGSFKNGDRTNFCPTHTSLTTSFAHLALELHQVLNNYFRTKRIVPGAKRMERFVCKRNKKTFGSRMEGAWKICTECPTLA